MTAAKSDALDVTDIAACYSYRGKQMADGKRKTPLAAIVVEFHDPVTHPDLTLFGGTGDMTQRECLALMLEAVAVLSAAAAGCNAEASN